MTTNGKLEGRISVPSGGWAVDATDSGGAFTATIAEQTYYLSTSDGTSTTFLEEFEDQLNAAGTDTWTVTIAAGEGGTGKVTITCSAAWTITWDAASTPVKEICGYTGNLSKSGGTGATSTNQAKGLWLPNCPPSNLYGNSVAGWYESSTRGQHAPDGTATVIGGPKRQVNELRWNAIKRAKALAEHEATTNESYMTFWLDFMQGDQTGSSVGRFRWYPDADDDATYFSYVMLDMLSNSRMEPLVQDWNGFFTVNLGRIGVAV